MRNTLCAALLALALAAPAQIRVAVDATRATATASRRLNGTNIEDLNNQTVGALSAQLLHGEAFAEGIDTDMLGLPRQDYSKLFVVLDDRALPHILTQTDIYTAIQWNNLSEPYDFRTADIYDCPRLPKPRRIGGYTFHTRFVPYDSLPAPVRTAMLARLRGPRQVSKYWTATPGAATPCRYTLVRDGRAYMGRQTQRMEQLGGGETALSNHGLYRMGLRLVGGKSYQGVVRARADRPATLYVQLCDSTGRVLCEQPCALRGDGTWERLAFTLTPDEAAAAGSFRMAVREPCAIDFGFASLSPCAWGLAGGRPLRREFVEALRREGIAAIRYNGSMVDQGPDKHLYRWKRMLGPADARRTLFRSGFNLCTTHTFGIVELLQAAELLGATAMIGMSQDETAEDIADFVEYCNGDTATTWGRRRKADGHPAPYALGYIEVDNERRISEGYVAAVKKFATAAWSRDAQMRIAVSLNIKPGRYARGTEAYRQARDLARWFIEQGKGAQLAWDSHYDGTRDFAADTTRYDDVMGIALQRDLAADLDGYRLPLTPMEENGNRCDWDRGLAHACNWIAALRHADCLDMAATANTFQPHGLHYMWDQGRIHYTADTLWFQPSAHIDQMMMQAWHDRVVWSRSADAATVAVAATGDAKALTVCLANRADTAQSVRLDIRGLNLRRARCTATTIGGCPLTALNTAADPDAVAPRPLAGTDARKPFTLPRHSFTIVQISAN